ncbi:MAG: chorismate mutase [Lentisphaeria bacterium]
MISALEKIRQWGLKTYERNPFLIAGPCSAESREQVLATARAVSHLPVSLFRAGVWKPKTFPETFAGMGNIALSWLQEVKAETGLPIAIEIDHPRHLEEALQADIDVFWIGARTTVNPFAVEELAKAFSGVDKPLLVKNPITPDLSAWVAAIERLQNRGINKLGVILRGFVNRHPSKWRYEPEWDMVLKFRQLYPDLPYLCDPSHIAGNTNMVFDICQQAMDLNFHGLMIETHFNPGKALSDAEQQLTPLALEDLLDRLILKNPDFTPSSSQNELNRLRQKIDRLDRKLLENLAARMDLVEQIGMLKKAEKMPVIQQTRWEHVLNLVREFAREHGLSKQFLEDIFNRIHQEAIRKQE